MPPFRKILATTALCLAAMGMNSCQTVEQRMISEITERERNFDAEARYSAYIQQRNGSRAQKLRKAAEEAATMRICISGGLGMEAEYLPLTDDEVAAVREILAEIEEVPPRYFNAWLLSTYDSYCLPQPSPPLFWCVMEFVAADGSVLHTFYDIESEMGDTAKAEEYRTKEYSPDLMLPEASRKRWEALPFHARLDARLVERHRNYRSSPTASILGSPPIKD
ncbi:MAG: hypothetical protein ACI4O9_05270 [Akkermansia sp.]